MKNSLARYRLYKSIGYSDREIDLMQIDADLLRDARHYLAIQERLMELTRYNCYTSDGLWLPDSAQFWEKQFEEEWRRKLHSDKFMPPSKKQQYKAILAYEVCELAEDYIKQYGISGNELLKLAVDAYLDYLRLPEQNAPALAQELAGTDSRELWQKICDHWIDVYGNESNILIEFSYLYWTLVKDGLLDRDVFPPLAFRKYLANRDVVLDRLKSESISLKSNKETARRGKHYILVKEQILK